MPIYCSHFSHAVHTLLTLFFIYFAAFSFIKIKDNGYGIPEEEIPYIFQRFTRVEQLQDKAIGTGLGLAVTQALVEAHEGVIEVSSIQGEGSEFTVTLPVTVQKEDF